MQFRIGQLSRLVNVSSVLKTAKTFNFKIRQEVSEIPAPVGRINGQQNKQQFILVSRHRAQKVG